MNNKTRGLMIALSAGTLLAACSSGTEQADTIFLNGDIITIDSANPTAEALAVVGDRIAVVGSQAEVMALRGGGTQVIDLQGRTLMPGFFQPHEHPSLTSVVFSWPDVSDQSVSTKEQVWAVIREAVKSKKSGEWVFINGWSRVIPGLETPSLKELDEIAPANPLFILQQIPYVAHANSLALEQVGISRDAPDPAGGFYGRDANGELNGTLFEGPAIFPFLMNPSLPDTPEDYEPFLRQELQRHAANGVTSFASMGLFLPPDVEIFPVYQRLADTKQYPRHFVYIAEFNLDKKMADAHPNDGTDYLRLGGVKFFFDGSLFSGTALLCEPFEYNEVLEEFHFKPGQNGRTAWEDQQALEKRLIQLHNDGWQLSGHVIGDCGARRLIDLYEKILIEARPREDHRHLIQHMTLSDPENFQRMADLGLSPSILLPIYYYFGELLEYYVGPERLENLTRVKSALDAGLRVTWHADAPLFMSSPLSMIQMAVIRTSKKGSVFNAEEAISVEEALKAATLNGAWQVHQENNLGSLEAGKLADLVVLADNPLKVDPDAIGEITVLQTWIGGRQVYQR